MKMYRHLSLALLFASTTAACVADVAPSDDDDGVDDLVDTSQANPGGGDISSHTTSSGVNSHYCAVSPYNCRFHEGDQRVLNAAGSEIWAIEPGASVRYGNGNAMLLETGTKMTFNFGQTRTIAGKAHALALTTSNGSSGWYPLDHIVSRSSFEAHDGNVDAKDPGQGKMACYEIRDSADATLAVKKVVYDSQEGPNGHERAGDYLSLVRNDGKRSANLIFSVPGFALGGGSTDHFPAGTHFQRVDVPTDSGHPSISIPLWVRNSAGVYKQQSGTMRFLYGYIVGDGAKRFGWIAQDAVTPSGGCD
jgi:hypothetical protein